MKNILLDTNALLSYVTDRNKKQSETMLDIFNRAGKLEFEICIISNVITEFVFVLQKVYKTKSELISNILRDMNSMTGVNLHHGFFPETLYSIWPDKVKDYSDAFLSAASIELNYPVATFDRKFGKQLMKLGGKIELL
jgi:predicted nucleic-acid-binding protein